MKRKIYILAFVSLFCVSCSSKSNILASDSAVKSAESHQIALPDLVINYGMKFLRTPYRYGGTTSRGFDCSGFTSHVYREFGYSLSRSSRDQAKQFPAVSKKRDLKTGDLVFFEGRSRNGKVGHVGIVTKNNGNGTFNFIHSSVKNGVIVSSSSEAYYASRYLKGGRVINKASYSVPESSTPISKSTYKSHHSSEHTNSNYIHEAQYHTVKRGESLSVIAKKYDVPISTIMHLNNLKSKKIKRGRRLLITEAVEKPKLKFVANIENNHLGDQDINTETLGKELEVKEENIDHTNPVIEEKYFEQNPTEAGTKPSKDLDIRFATKSRKHRVASGESLYSIAKRYNLSLKDLKRLNNLNSSNIKAGQMLYVVNEVDTEDQLVKSEISENQTIIHTVKTGETLYDIARKYGCSISQIRDWNPNFCGEIIAGDKIKIAKK